MGIDLKTFIRHNFDVHNMDKMAEDLAQRLNVTVVYGYYDDWHDGTEGESFEKDPEEANTYHVEEEYYDDYFIIKGYAGDNENKVYQLIRNNYLLSLLQPTELPDIDYDFYECYPGNSYSFDLPIYRECVTASLYFGRADSFFSFFTGFTYKPEMEVAWFHEFREKIYAQQKLLGTDTFVFYVPDYFDELEKDPNTATWDELVSNLYNQGRRGKVIDLGDWFRAGAILEKQTPFAVIDDFSYWP